MPGQVVQVAVSTGEEVAKGQKLLSIEAMKMETALNAPIGGRVKEVHIRPGATVDARDLLITLTPES